MQAAQQAIPTATDRPARFGLERLREQHSGSVTGRRNETAASIRLLRPQGRSPGRDRGSVGAPSAPYAVSTAKRTTRRPFMSFTGRDDQIGADCGGSRVARSRGESHSPRSLSALGDTGRWPRAGRRDTTVPSAPRWSQQVGGAILGALNRIRSVRGATMGTGPGPGRGTRSGATPTTRMGLLCCLFAQPRKLQWSCADP